MKRTQITLSSLLNKSWSNMKDNISQIIYIFLIVFGMGFLTSAMRLEFLSSIIMSILSVGISLEMYDAFKNDRKISPSGVFYKIKERNLDYWLLVIVIQVKVFLWSLLFVIPGVIKGLEYQRALYLKFEDKEMSNEDAFSRAREEMMGLKGTLFSAKILPSLIFIIPLSILTVFAAISFSTMIHNSSIMMNDAHLTVPTAEFISAILPTILMFFVIMFVAAVISIFVVTIEPTLNVLRSNEICQDETFVDEAIVDVEIKKEESVENVQNMNDTEGELPTT